MSYKFGFAFFGASRNLFVKKNTEKIGIKNLLRFSV